MSLRLSPVPLLTGALAACFPVPLPGQRTDFRPEVVETPRGEIMAGGTVYESRLAFIRSDFFRENRMRCGTRISSIRLPGGGGNPGDCGKFITQPGENYDPSRGGMRIPVVVHVIQHSDGRGYIGEERVRSQIDILNEDFLALSGTSGASGTDTQIEFFLAEVDPAGNFTSGITYSTRNQWYNDRGDFMSSLAWDTRSYLNIYTNSAGGDLGYVLDLPQEIVAGSTDDGVVILHEAFGRGAPLAGFNLGKTTTHEVGHYLGLYHTFNEGCHPTDLCYIIGDFICDTNPQVEPTSGCPEQKGSCLSPDPFHNYMDYSDDRCMTNFTPEQARRMRCTLLNYRPDLFETDEPVIAYLRGDPNASGETDLADVLYVLNALFASGSFIFPCHEAANINGDAEVNIADPVYLLFHLFAGGASPPPPFPGCSVDPDPRLGCLSYPDCL